MAMKRQMKAKPDVTVTDGAELCLRPLSFHTMVPCRAHPLPLKRLRRSYGLTSSSYIYLPNDNWVPPRSIVFCCYDGLDGNRVS